MFFLENKEEFMKKKAIISLLACGVIAAGATMGLTACGKGNKGLTVWASSDEQATLKKMIAAFKEQNPDFGLDIKTDIVGAGDAVSKISVDVSASADVYCFANDQIVNLINYTALSPLPDAAVDRIKEANDANAVEAGKFGSKYYGYPYAADNGYFLYYNKNIMTEEEAGSLEGILAACKKSGKYFIYNMPEAWYTGAFFLGTGESCVGGAYNVEYEGTVVSSASVNFGEKVSAGSEYTIGEIGGQGMIDLNAHSNFISGDDTTIAQYLNGDNSGTKFGACVSGTWNASTIQEKLGEGYAATKLPTFRSSLDGNDYQMGSLAGYKHIGVNPNSKHVAEAHKLAEFLTNEAMQELRFDDMQTGPSNKNVAKLQKVKDNVALAALVAQAPYATVQGAFPGSYWDAMKAFGANCEGSSPTITSANLKTQLETFIAAFKVGD